EIAVINSAIAFYQNTIADPITVSIQFADMSSGLGSSETIPCTLNYRTFITALRNHATGADDALALASGRLPSADTNPVNGTTTIQVKGPNARALGIGASCSLVEGFDGLIGMRTAITDADGGPYSLLAVVEHEIDEVLGLGSSLPNCDA